MLELVPTTVFEDELKLVAVDFVLVGGSSVVLGSDSFECWVDAADFGLSSWARSIAPSAPPEQINNTASLNSCIIG